MKKSDITALLQAYDGKNAGNLFSNHYSALGQPFARHYQKGLRKRLFGVRTDGMNELAKFLQSPHVKKLSDRETIHGEALTQLLDILQKRDHRILHTQRSYEKYPDKSTNRVYNRLYEILWLDVARAQEEQEETPDVLQIMAVLFKRESNKKLLQYERAAKKGAISLDSDKQIVSGCHRLGVALATGKAIQFESNQTVKTNQTGDFDWCTDNTHTTKVFEFDGQKITAVFTRFVGDLKSLLITPNQIKLGHDVNKGIEWLKYGSKKGDKTCSYQLAEYYACISETIYNEQPNPDEAEKYLRIAAKQGSRTATSILDRGGQFGKITLDPDEKTKHRTGAQPKY